MKKFLLMAALVLPMMVMMTGCSKDLTEDLVGSYKMKRTGNLSLIVNGQTSTIPMNNSGTVSISKISNNSIRIGTGDDSYVGTISGNHISFESLTFTLTDQTGTGTINVSASGTISGSTINIQETYSGTYYYNGMSFPMSGSGSVVMDKLY